MIRAKWGTFRALHMYVGSIIDKMDGWMTCDFTSFLRVFQSYQDQGWVQWNSVYDCEDFASSGDRTRSARSVGQRLTHWAPGAPNNRQEGVTRIVYGYFFVKKKYCDTSLEPLAGTVLMRGQNMYFRLEIRKYSRTSMARTRMARLPRLFRNRSWVPRKKSLGCRFGIILCDFLFFYIYIENGILWVFIRIASMRRF